MKLSASQSPVQSDDAVNIHPSGALSEATVAESLTSTSRCSCCELLAGGQCNTSGPLSEGNRQGAEPQALVAGAGVGRQRHQGDIEEALAVRRRRWLRRERERGRVRVDSVRDGVLLVPRAGDVFL